jgi:serine O-acetyltransferase
MSDAADAQTDGRPEPGASSEFGLVGGLSLDEAKARTELPASQYRLWQLIWSDYVAHYREAPESDRRRALMFLPRMFVNPSMHACLLFRLITGTPVYMNWFWRRLLIALHACECLPYTRIGPGLRMPHPMGILIGYGVIGRDVTIQHNVTLSPVRTNWRTGKLPGLFHIGDEVVVFPGSIVAGPIAVGDGAIIGANALITRDLPAGHITNGRKSRPATTGERLGIE